MATEPLTPQDIDALLRPDPRTTSADLLVLRDALRRLGDAWERLAHAAGQLEDVARSIEQRGGARRRRAAAPRAPARGLTAGHPRGA